MMGIVVIIFLFSISTIVCLLLALKFRQRGIHRVKFKKEAHLIINDISETKEMD